MARTIKRAWSVDEVAEALKAAADPQIKTIFQRRNPEGSVWGVRFGDMEKIVKQIKPDADLAAELWELGAAEPRILAIRLLPPGTVSAEQAERWVNDMDFPILPDEFARVMYHSSFAREKMEVWIDSKNDYVQRTGWALLYGFAGDPDSTFTDLEWRAWLERIGATIHDAPNWSREMMNNLPIAIGLRNPDLFKFAVATARDYGNISVFHGDKTNCKVNDAVELLNNPKTRIVRY